MRIVYFHGWNGIFDENRAKILAKFGDEVYYPNINYQIDRNLINMYYSDLSNGNPTLIVGSSLGGYLAHYVSNLMRCPSLIMNPSFFMKNGAELRSGISCMECFDKQIIISGKDNEIDVKRVLKFLKESGYDSQINLCRDLGHHIPLDIFENIFTEFREKYKDFTFEKQDKEKCSKISKVKTKTTNQAVPFPEPPIQPFLYYEQDQVRVTRGPDEQDQVRVTREVVREVNDQVEPPLEALPWE